MLSSGEINTIGQLLNTTWGATLNGGKEGYPRGLSVPLSVKGHLVTTQTGEIQLVVSYTDFVTFRSDQEAQASVKRHRATSERVCLAYIAELKKKFKATEARGLKAKFIRDIDSLETIYTPTPEVSLICRPALRPAFYRGYYRYTTVYAVS